MKNLYNVLLGIAAFVGTVAISSCSSDDMILSEQQDTIHTIRLKMQASVASYSDAPASRSTTSWEEGSRLFIYSSSVKGSARYNNGYWTLSYTGNISNDVTCELYYFENPISTDDNGAVLNYSTAMYKSTTAKLIKGNDEVTLEGSLTPVSPRIRFKDANESNVSIKGVVTYTNYTNDTNTFTTSTEDEISLASISGYTPYLYLSDKNQNQELTITVSNCIFKRTLNSTQLSAGKSGYFETPTQADPKGWTFVSKAPAPIWDGTVAQDFARGKGTIASPYIIETGAQLLHIKDVDSSNKYFKLANDIDLDNKNWLPIPDFRGYFDGNGCSIKNLKIHRGDSKVGLFAQIDGEVKNVIIKGVDIESSGFNAGVLAGYYHSKKALDNIRVIFLENSKIEGGSNVGGIIGQIGGYSTEIINCVVESATSNYTILGNKYVGGILGHNGSIDVYIENCHVAASLAGEETSGGIAGSMVINACTVKNCSFKGNIAGNGICAGIVGQGCEAIGGCKVEANIEGDKCYYFGSGSGSTLTFLCVASYFNGTIAGTNNHLYQGMHEYILSCYICLKLKDGSISAFAIDDSGHQSKNGEDITTYLKESYSEYADFWNFNNTWTFEGKIDGKNVKVSCPRLAWE